MAKTAKSTQFKAFKEIQGQKSTGQSVKCYNIKKKTLFRLIVAN